MMREKYESLAVHDLKEIARSRGIKGVSAMKKADVIEAMLLLDAESGAVQHEAKKEAGREEGRKREAVPSEEGNRRSQQGGPSLPSAEIRSFGAAAGARGTERTE